MWCIPIVGPTFDEVSNQMSEAIRFADVLEFRIDLFHEYTMKNLTDLRKKIKKPLIFTLRKKSQGGHFEGSEALRLEEIGRLAELEPDYFDLEYDTSLDFIEKMRREFPQIKLIISYHNFTCTPTNLHEILSMLKKIPGLHKISCQARSILDSLRMLEFARSHPPLLAMCMGEMGAITRILSPLVGSPWTYAALNKEEKSAEGQLTIDELSAYTLYHHKMKNHPSITSKAYSPEKSAIYGLIGGDTSQSLSALVHNKAMQANNIPGVYVKMNVTPEELSPFLSLASKLNFRGLSVTMPLKEQVISFLDEIDPATRNISAVNTILFQNEKMIGYNTDGKGALDAIEAKRKVKNKHVIVLGAGGAARAIIYEAIHRGARVTILNRTKEKAVRLAKHFEIEARSLEEIPEVGAYDIIINTTPNPMPIAPSSLLPHHLVMDIKTRPQMTPLLQQAQVKGCTLVFGYEMFVNQALGQYDHWFPSQFDRERIKKALEEEMLKQLKAVEP